MGKSKKLDAKLRVYYKGPAKKPTKVATEDEMKLMETALLECLPNRATHSFKCTWMGEEANLKIIVGLSACLRQLKHGYAKALILDDTASVHVAGLLIEFANKLNIPVVRASKLVLLAPKVDLTALLVMCLVDASSHQDENMHQDSDPRPKLKESSIDSEAFNELASYLQSAFDGTGDQCKFKMPQTARVSSSGKSKAKKIVRKGEKQSKRLQQLEAKQNS